LNIGANLISNIAGTVTNLLIGEAVKRAIAWFLVVGGMAAMGIFLFALTSYRFKNETLTETQLAIWSIQRWWAWVPALIAAGAGLWIVGHEDEPRDFH
jgi:membrane protein required for beta-lactamase induction